MAQFRRRRGTKVYVYYCTNGRQIQLPRKETKHLDKLPDAAVLQWVEDWEQDNGKPKDRIRRAWLRPEDRLFILWEGYKKHQLSLGGVRATTFAQTNRTFNGHLLPYFIGKHEQKDPSKWYSLVPGLFEHLLGAGLAQSSIKKVLQVLGHFGRWMVYQQILDYPFTIVAPKAPNHKVTPLKKRMAPEDILHCRLDDKHEIPLKLLVMIGYFFSLRPSELFALERADFMTGDAARLSCRAFAGLQSVGCGSGLSVVVSKTLVDGSESKPLTKSDHSYGVVNCWDKRAAQSIAAALKSLPEGRIVGGSRSWLDRAWKDNIKILLNLTAHDLRRASILYLGRTIRVPLITLQEHARHAEIETTLLYTRDPSIPEILAEQDFDDVI